MTEREIHTIDAFNKSPGRIAATIAVLLRGKQKADFEPHRDMGDTVVVKNVKKMKITGRKMLQKKYSRHTGFPGGLRQATMKEVMEKKPEEVLKSAVWGMLPGTRLRSLQMKRLRFE